MSLALLSNALDFSPLSPSCSDLKHNALVVQDILNGFESPSCIGNTHCSTAQVSTYWQLVFTQTVEAFTPSTGV